MATHDVTTLSHDELEAELATLASHIYAGTCRWLELVGELDRRGGWAESGRNSCAEWLAWRCALTPRAAREHVRVARALPELPLVRAAFARGELSYGKVRELARVATAECEGELVELAGCMTAAQLERAARAYRRVTSEEARDAHERASLTYHWEEDGSLSLRARLAPEDGALLVTALQAAREALRERRREEQVEAPEGEQARREPTEEAEERAEVEPAPAAPRRFQPTPEQLRVTHLDALVAMADLALARAPGERSGGERAQVVVHVDAAVLAGDEGGRCELEEGPAISPETARRIACDASLVTLLEREGETLSVGRKTRSVSGALRRALQARDRGCRFPGCENTRFLDAHHVQHWAKGGETRLDNLILLCRPHHRYLHEEGCRLERLEDGSVRFRNRYGVVIPSVPRPPPSDREALREENRRRGLVIDADTCGPGIADPMDLSMAVDALDEIIA